MCPSPGPPRARLRRVAVQALHLPVALTVEAGLLDEPGAELGERRRERVDLVQRILDVELGVELELQVDPLRTVGDLEDPRLRVGVPATLVAEPVALRELAPRGVFDVGDYIGAAVEAGEVGKRRTSTRAL